MTRFLTSAMTFLVVVLATLTVYADTPPAYVELDDGPTIVVDWSRSSTQAVTLHGNRTFIFAKGQRGGKYLLIVKQDESGSRTVTWPTSVHWPGDQTQAPTLTTTGNKKDYITFFYDGLTYDLVGFSQGL